MYRRLSSLSLRHSRSLIRTGVYPSHRVYGGGAAQSLLATDRQAAPISPTTPGCGRWECPAGGESLPSDDAGARGPKLFLAIGGDPANAATRLRDTIPRWPGPGKPRTPPARP